MRIRSSRGVAIGLAAPLVAAAVLAEVPTADASPQPVVAATASPTALALTNPALVAPSVMIVRSQRQQVLHRIAGQITENLSESARAAIPGFTDIVVDPDPDHSHLRLYWKGKLPQRVERILAHLPKGVTADVVAAQYSKAELHAARNRLLKGGKPVDLRLSAGSTPLRITSIGPAGDGSGLVIGYDEDRGVGRRDAMDPLTNSSRQTRSSQVRAITAHMTGVNVQVVYKPLVEDTSRQQDSSPWYGGAALKNPGGGICSSGFAVTSTTTSWTGSPYLLTSAYHCGPTNAAEWHTWWGNVQIGYGDLYQSSGPDDVIGIVPDSGATGGRLYDGPPTDTSGYSKAVVGWGHNNRGEYVCTDGANGGVHCNVQISQTDIGVTGGNGIYRPITDLAYATSGTPGGVAAVNGDSGGPVFAGVNNYTADEARGTITALDTTVTCPSDLNSSTVLDGYQRTPWCLKGVYYVPIYQTLTDMNWTLVTG
jgi:hypothetical protein